MRTGLVAKKVGMSAIFNSSGDRVPVTLLKIEGCQVINSKIVNGKNKLEVGAFDKNVNRTSKPLKGYFAKHQIAPKQKIVEFNISEDAVINSGTELEVNHFVVGQYVDVVGTSIGKGFAGVMKRHNFGGLRASHGVSVSHRSHGSTGQRQDPGKVFKGKKMAGHMGVRRVTKQNLQVVLVDVEKKIIAVRGSVPGAKESFLVIQDAVKRALPTSAPFPCFIGKNTSQVMDEQKQDKVEESEA
jgi:large subunit ribosomal protein L3